MLVCFWGLFEDQNERGQKKSPTHVRTCPQSNHTLPHTPYRGTTQQRCKMSQKWEKVPHRRLTVPHRTAKVCRNLLSKKESCEKVESLTRKSQLEKPTTDLDHTDPSSRTFRPMERQKIMKNWRRSRTVRSYLTGQSRSRSARRRSGGAAGAAAAL